VGKGNALVMGVERAFVQRARLSGARLRGSDSDSQQPKSSFWRAATFGNLPSKSRRTS